MIGDFKRARDKMVKHQLAVRGIKDKKILAAMRAIPRHEFVPKGLRHRAYDDCPLPIGEDQTISQPYIVAYMTALLGLKGGEKILEIGTGCGYAAAVLSEIAGKVYTIERHEVLAQRAEETLKSLCLGNISVICGDGTKGLPAEAPFDGIVVTAAGPSVPNSLKKQLSVGGKLVIPVGAGSYMQDMVRVTRLSEAEYEEEKLLTVSFVPLIGEEGWKDKSQSG